MLRNFLKKYFGRSLWVYHCNSGGCNGCDIEVVNVLTPYYDVERFGIKLVGSPRHADVMLCQGPAGRATAPALRRAYAAMPEPKLVFAIGSCACGGGAPRRRIDGFRPEASGPLRPKPLWNEGPALAAGLSPFSYR